MDTIRLVPPPTPEYRVKVRFRFTGEDTPRIQITDTMLLRADSATANEKPLSRDDR